MRRTEPVRIEMMPMRGTDQEGRLLREGMRHLVYRGPLRIGEIEETTLFMKLARNTDSGRA